jgi:segregation and condensation protein B
VSRDPGPGQAVLYGTTSQFLEKLGLDSTDQLPSLAEFVPGPEVMEMLEAGLRHQAQDDTDHTDAGGEEA